jgi:hypothetical protein
MGGAAVFSPAGRFRQLLLHCKIGDKKNHYLTEQLLRK